MTVASSEAAAALLLLLWPGACLRRRPDEPDEPGWEGEAYEAVAARGAAELREPVRVRERTPPPSKVRVSGCSVALRSIGRGRRLGPVAHRAARHSQHSPERQKRGRGWINP